MKHIFITYGDKVFQNSKKRLLKEVKALGFFDACISYGPEDMPLFIKSSPLMAYSRLGGYSCWKPYIIWKTMQEYPDSVVVYLDAGCSVRPSAMWAEWFKMMENTDTLLMAYRPDFDYGWGKLFGRMSVKIGDWTKSEVASYFDDMYKEKDWRDFTKIMSGIVFARNSSHIIKAWLDISLLYPHLFYDPLSIETEPSSFIQHRHDQSVLTLIAYKYRKEPSIVQIIPETSESHTEESGILATRIHDSDMCPQKPKILLKTKGIHLIKKVIGSKLYESIHRRLFEW